MLSENGLEILHVYKDWDGTTISNDSYQMIYVCKKVSYSKDLNHLSNF